jgi:hypothetical protein
MTDSTTSHASELYSVVEYSHYEMNNVCCEICHLHLPWSVDLDDPEVGLLVWHHHLVKDHPGVALQRMSTTQAVGSEPLVKVSEYNPRAQHNSTGVRHQRRLVREFRSSSSQAPLSWWFSEHDELNTAKCGRCEYRVHSSLGLDRGATERDMDYHLVSKHPNVVVHSLVWRSRLQASSWPGDDAMHSVTW